MALIGVTDHQVKTIKKISATVRLGDKKIRHIMHVMRDDFLVDYEGILEWIFCKSTKLEAIRKITCKLME